MIKLWLISISMYMYLHNLYIIQYKLEILILIKYYLLKNFNYLMYKHIWIILNDFKFKDAFHWLFIIFQWSKEIHLRFYSFIL